MKKSLALIIFLTISLTGFAQQSNTVTSETNIVDTEKVIKEEVVKASVSSKLKAKVLKINHKKSNEIISIKAYRRSLKIKVKTVKTC